MTLNVNTSNALLLLPEGTEEDITGNFNTILSAGHDILGISGSRNTITVGGGSRVSITGGSENVLTVGGGSIIQLNGGVHNRVIAAAGDSVTVSGNGQVDAARAHAITLSSGKIMLVNAASAFIIGNSNAITAQSHDNLTLAGTGNTLTVGSDTSIRFNGLGNNIIEEAAGAAVSANEVIFDNHTIGQTIKNGSTDSYGRKYELKGATLTITSPKDTLVIHNFKNGDFGVNIPIPSSFKSVFFGFDSDGVSKLWITDGTQEGTKALASVETRYYAPYYNPHFINNTTVVKINEKIFFNGFDSQGKDGIWITDGTEKGTKEIYSIAYITPKSLVVLNNKLLFTGVYLTEDNKRNYGTFITNTDTGETTIVSDIIASDPQYNTRVW